MSAAAAWIMSILGVVIIGTLIDLILPNGRMNKYIKSIFATVTVLIIVLPLPSLIKNNFRFEDGKLFNTEFTLDENYLEYAENMKMEYLAKGVEEMLAQDGLKSVSVKITGTFSGGNADIKMVEINLAKLVIDEKLEHINKYELVKELTAKYLSIDKGIVTVYG